MEYKGEGLRHPFGAIIAEYREEWMPGCLAGFTITIATVFISDSVFSHTKENGFLAIFDSDKLINLLCGPIMLPFAVFFTFLVIKGVNDAIIIYRHGFEYRRRNRTHSRAWREIDDIDHSIQWDSGKNNTVTTEHSFIIRAKGKPDIELQHTKKFLEIGKIIQERTAEYSVPDALSRIERGCMSSEHLGQ